MKKLMIVAAVAAMTGASFAACERGTVDNSGGANVYQLQMQLKSTWGLPCGGGVDASLCGRDTTNAFSVLRTPASFVINAWLYTCTNACYTLENAGGLVAWEQNRAKLFTSPTITWKLLNIIGVSADQAEAEFDFVGKIVDYSNGASATALGATWTIRCAGQGTFGKYETVPKYMFLSGYCAGEVSASYYIQGKICEASKVATCASALNVCPQVDAPSAVFGRWALRYNTEASVQYFNNGTLNVPSNIK